MAQATSELRQSKRARITGMLLAKVLRWYLLNAQAPIRARPLQLNMGDGDGEGQRSLVDVNTNKGKGKRPLPLEQS